MFLLNILKLEKKSIDLKVSQSNDYSFLGRKRKYLYSYANFWNEPFVLSVPWHFGLAHLTLQGQGKNTQGTDKIKGSRNSFSCY